MKAIKIYLIVVTVLLLIAISLGVYVWYTVQTVETNETTRNTIEHLDQTNPSTMQTSEGDIDSNIETSETESKTVMTKPIVVKKDSLSDTQKNMLETLGYSESTITITPEMIACGEEAVGAGRLKEITDGSAPSPLESVKLLPCFKK
jgi:hypothetical protein